PRTEARDEPLLAAPGRAVLREGAAVGAGRGSGDPRVRVFDGDLAPARARVPVRASGSRRPRLLRGEGRSEPRPALAVRPGGLRLRHRLRRGALPGPA